MSEFLDRVQQESYQLRAEFSLDDKVPTDATLIQLVDAFGGTVPDDLSGYLLQHVPPDIRSRFFRVANLRSKHTEFHVIRCGLKVGAGTLALAATMLLQLRRMHREKEILNGLPPDDDVDLVVAGWKLVHDVLVDLATVEGTTAEVRDELRFGIEAARKRLA